MRQLISCFLFVLLSPKVFSEVSPQSVLTYASLSGTGGFLLGLSHKNNKVAYSTMYGGLAFSAVAILGLLKLKNEKNRSEIDQLIEKKHLFLPYKPHLTDYGDSYFVDKKLPKHLEEIVIKGSWSIYKIEKSIGSYFWQEVEQNTFIKGDEIFKFEPPKINPKIQKLHKGVFND